MGRRRVLVTGASGFIGKHLLERLAQESVEFAALVRSEWPASAEGLTLLYADLLDFPTLKRKIDEFKPDIVFHLGGQKMIGESWHAFWETYQINLVGTMNLLRCFENTKVQSIILVNSSAEYGKGPAPYREGHTARPVSVYGASKAAATILGNLCHKYFRLPIIILRPTLVYGPGQGEQFFLSQLCRAVVQGQPFSMSPGEQYRDFIFVSDVIEALWSGVNRAQAIGGIYNIGSGKAYSLRAVAEMVYQIIGGNRELLQLGTKPYRSDEQFAYCVDINLARQVLKWQPQVTLEQGLLKTVDWYKKSMNSIN